MGTVAIIKTGELETFHERDPGGTCSLGDVVRTTPLLSLFAGDAVDWYASPASVPLLIGTPGIHRVIDTDPSRLRAKNFATYDQIISLERHAAWGQVLTGLPAEKIVGFHRPGAPLDIAAWKTHCIAAGKPAWQDWLFALLGHEWTGEGYRLRPVSARARWDIGLNLRVGGKWPGKAAPMAEWARLHEFLARTHSLDWQQGHQDIERYLEWIASCRLLITHDSLGLHLALALRIPVVALFGASAAEEVPLSGAGERIFLRQPDLEIDEHEVAAAIARLLPPKAKGRSRIARPPLLELETRA